MYLGIIDKFKIHFCVLFLDPDNWLTCAEIPTPACSIP